MFLSLKHRGNEGLEQHSQRLDYLVSHPEEIDEDKFRIEAILREPIWMIDHTGLWRIMPDLFFLMYNGNTSIIEYKSDVRHRPKAIEQLDAGEEYAEKVLHRCKITKKFVHYSHSKFAYEVVK